MMVRVAPSGSVRRSGSGISSALGDEGSITRNSFRFAFRRNSLRPNGLQTSSISIPPCDSCTVMQNNARNLLDSQEPAHLCQPEKAIDARRSSPHLKMSHVTRSPSNQDDLIITQKNFPLSRRQAGENIDKWEEKSDGESQAIG